MFQTYTILQNKTIAPSVRLQTTWHYHSDISSVQASKSVSAAVSTLNNELMELGLPMEAQWPIRYGVGLRIKRSSVRIRPWPLRWVLGQGSLLPLSQGEAFTLASISYLAILVKYILAKKKKKIVGGHRLFLNPFSGFSEILPEISRYFLRL